MKKILVPTDFSSQAFNALKAAVILAKKFNAELTLLHILDLPSQTNDQVSTGTPAPEVMFFKEAAEKKLNDLALSPLFEGLQVETSLVLDRTSFGVIKSAQSNECDLIVIGSHGISGVRKQYIGSNTAKVIRHAKIPVLVIKTEVIDFDINKFIFASDFSDGMKDAFKRALNFNKTLNSTFYPLMVNTPNNFKPTHVAKELLDDFLQDITTSEYELAIYNDLSIERGIENFADEIGADLIGIATHGRKGISHFFNGSISEDLVNHIQDYNIITFRVD